MAAVVRSGRVVLDARALAVVHDLLTLTGLVPGPNITFGFILLFGHDVWLPALSATVATSFGFADLWLRPDGRSAGDRAADPADATFTRH